MPLDRTPGHHALFSVHGLGVQLTCDVPAMWSDIDHVLGMFGVAEFPPGFTTTSGHVRAFDTDEVARHVSTHAVAVPVPDDLIELYQDGERFWLVDDRWGICEMNLLKGTWRSWVLPHALADTSRCVEMAVVWPLAQLLRLRGLYLLPAVGLERDGVGVLLVSGFNLLPEIEALVRTEGFRIVGQRWTALRDDATRVEMLHLPGLTERVSLPTPGTLAIPRPTGLVDLHDEFPDAKSLHAFCDVVVLVEPGRRGALRWQDLTPGQAQGAVRSYWPIIELHPQRRSGQLAARLSRVARVGKLQLSRDPEALVGLLHRLTSQVPPRVSVSLHPVAPHAVAV